MCRRSCGAGQYRATGIRASSIAPLVWCCMVQSATFIGKRRSRVGFTSLGKFGVCGMNNMASDLHLSA